MLRKRRVFVVVSINIAFAVCFITINQLQKREESSSATDGDEWKRKQTYSVHVNTTLSREDDSSAVEIVSLIFSDF